MSVHIYSVRGSTWVRPLPTWQGRRTEVDEVSWHRTKRWFLIFSFRVTYSLDHSFIVRYLPNGLDQTTIQRWDFAFMHALKLLISTPRQPFAPGCVLIRATSTFDRTDDSPSFCWLFSVAFNLGHEKKRADSGVRLTISDYPSVVATRRVSPNCRPMRSCGSKTL